MKIAFVVPYVPSLIRVRSYNLIRHLIQRGHQVSVFTLWSDESELADLDHLREHCHEVIALPISRWRSILNCVLALPGRLPLQAVYSWHPRLAFQTESYTGGDGRSSYDIMHIEHLRGGQYGLSIRSRRPELPLVWDSVDCISYLFEQAAGQSRSAFGRLITAFDLGRTRRYEGSLPGRFDHVLITSPVDRDALLELVPPGIEPAPVSVLPNGVDIAYFQGGEPVDREPASIVLSGKMSYHANITMAIYLANEVMPYVWQHRPDASLTIVGKDPPASIQSLASTPAVTVTGTVDDIRPYLYRATVAAVPLIYGAGSQFKLLEAMACGTPVVATTRAVSALEVRVGEDLLVADHAERFATEILRVINDSEIMHRLSRAGKKYVEDHHSWVSIAAQLEGIYHETIGARDKYIRK